MQTLLRTLASSVILAILAACGQNVELPGTGWVIATVDGVDAPIEATIEFPTASTARYVSACGEYRATVNLRSDQGLSFGQFTEVPGGPPSCPDAAWRLVRVTFDPLSGVTGWRAVSAAAIELTGAHILRLERLQ